jgi:hypothetical protein
MDSKDIDPRLSRICQHVTIGTSVSIIQGLEKNNLTKRIPHIDDWELCGQLTESGYKLISDAVCIGIEEFFLRSIMHIPLSVRLNEKLISNNIVANAGIPLIRTKQNKIDINFTSEKALILKISSYLDPNIESPKADIVKNLEINLGGICFYQANTNRN